MLNQHIVLSLILLTASPIGVSAQPSAPMDAQIQNRLAKFVGGKKKAPGVAVSLIDQNGSRVFTAGQFDAKDSKPIDGDTIFEIGSITKVFTATVLQDMVDRGELKLDDPIGKFFPTSVKTPTRKGKQITLLDLATQSSGLPRLPDNLSIFKRVSSNPYNEYGPKQLYAFLSDYKLSRDIGAKYEYSNVGVGLLGHILELKAGTNYEGLIVERICVPLKMTSTRIALGPDLKARLAPGHNDSGEIIENWDFQALAGAGALRSSVNDMLKFLAANMGLTNQTGADSKGSQRRQGLYAAMAKAQEPRRDVELGRRIGLCWHVNTDGVTWHNGGTGGYRSFMGFSKKLGRGVVVLANSGAAETDGLGLTILGPTGT